MRSFLTAALLLVALPTTAQSPPTTDLRLWLRADAGVTTDASGNVSAWADQSGSALVATQATVAKRPTLLAAGMGGQPALDSDGANGYLVLGDVLDDVFAGADKQFEMFVAFRHDGGGTEVRLSKLGIAPTATTTGNWRSPW